MAWLDCMVLTKYKDQARKWCDDVGAAEVSEILDHANAFADALGLLWLERKRVLKQAEARSVPETPEGHAGGNLVAAPRVAAGAVPSASRKVQPPPGVFNEFHSFLGPPEDPRRYVVGKKLGEGFTAIVYECRRGADVSAVKTVGLSKLRIRQDFERIVDTMRREVSILFKLNHPRIVRLYEVIEEFGELHQDSLPKTIHLVMEKVEGPELFQKIIDSLAFTEQKARYVFTQITEALHYIHSQNLVHRDLKPENIIVDEARSQPDFLEIKLVDFGYSKHARDGYSLVRTQVGTPQYVAPEVFHPEPGVQGYDETVDLWSLGVTLFVMLIGKYPFPDNDAPPQDMVHIRRSALGNEISEEAQDLIRSLIRVQHTERLPLASCLEHPWVTIEGDGFNKHLRKLETEIGAHAVEERIRLPVEPSREQLTRIRRELYGWTKMYRYPAEVANGEIVAKLRDDTGVGHDQVEAREGLQRIVRDMFFPAPRHTPAAEQTQTSQLSAFQKHGNKFHIVNTKLCVHKDFGAGIDLLPERHGMRVKTVCDLPGQPGLQGGDLIVKIADVKLFGEGCVEELFGANFKHGAILTVRRPCLS